MKYTPAAVIPLLLLVSMQLVHHEEWLTHLLLSLDVLVDSPSIFFVTNKTTANKNNRTTIGHNQRNE
jgi:hypothetical protein